MFLVLRGGSENSNFFQFQIFPKLGTRGGRQISNFSQIQKSPNHPRGGGGGQENCGLFPLFGTFFFNASLTMNIEQDGLLTQESFLSPFWFGLDSKTILVQIDYS